MFEPRRALTAAPRKPDTPQTWGERDVERQKEAAEAAAWERANPKLPADEPIAKMSGRAVVKPIAKKTPPADVLAKPDLIGVVSTNPRSETPV